MNYFLIVAVVVISVLFLFLGFRITGFGNYSWLIAGIILGLILMYPLIWYDVLPNFPDKILRTIIHFDMGILGILLTLLLVRDIVFVPISFFYPLVASYAFTKKITTLIFITSVILIMIGYWNAQKNHPL